MNIDAFLDIQMEPCLVRMVYSHLEVDIVAADEHETVLDLVFLKVQQVKVRRHVVQLHLDLALVHCLINKTIALIAANDPVATIINANFGVLRRKLVKVEHFDVLKSS